eukprot:1157476-Pelagomonas_calceolata.AAC.5
MRQLSLSTSSQLSVTCLGMMPCFEQMYCPDVTEFDLLLAQFNVLTPWQKSINFVALEPCPGLGGRVLGGDHLQE